ncbi:MAG: toll/interleukin-1 receptor domain-containing protein, partial [Armatimonadetes bacterium]|nr:toll/interleukin-1 receptor domain-containing protein [Anaerolineae bacterium]
MTTTQDGLRIFISYAREDGKALAVRLRDDLQSQGYTPWLDMSDISGGAVWTERIEDAIEGCHIMLALLTHASFKSDNCRAEHLRAIRKGKRIIPILVQADADRPIHLEHLNYLDFADANRYSEKLRDLLSDVTAGQAFMPPGRVADAFKTRHAARAVVGEKRDAGAFRRHIADLRRSEWLGSRYWWAYFLFAFADMPAVVELLTVGALVSPAQ